MKKLGIKAKAAHAACFDGGCGRNWDEVCGKRNT